MYRTSWNDLQQSRESPGNLWASNPRLTFVLQAWCEEGGFHLRLIFSQLRVTKLPLKQKQSRSSAKSSWTETSCTNSATYRGCHIHRKKKMWFDSFWWPWECFSQLLLRNELLSFQVTRNEMTLSMCCAQDFMLTCGPTLEMETLECLEIFIFTLSD